MNVLAGWFVMVGLVVGLSDVADAIEKHGQQCVSHNTKEKNT